MAPPLRIRSEPFRPLAALDGILNGPRAYYWRLKDAADPVLQVGAWAMLLDGHFVTAGERDALLAMSRHGAVRQRAFAHFEERLEHDESRIVAGTAGASITELQRQLMFARLAGDFAAAAELHGALYLETGDINQLRDAAIAAENAGGWRAGLAWAVRRLAVAPLEPGGTAQLFGLLDLAGEGELMQELAEILAARHLHAPVLPIFLASAALARGEPKRALALLQPFDEARLRTPPVLTYAGPVRALRAAAEERQGNYKAAYAAYVALNAAERDSSIDPKAFVAEVDRHARLAIPPLPADNHPAVVQMLGFPRSGTTLLENALAAHPAIETFEETDALNAACVPLDDPKRQNEPAAARFAEARQRYFSELAHLSRKPDATVRIDKMPIRSAEAGFMSRLFPEWRYIFSIRHPFDVALSCFRQRFAPNQAMENFRSFEGTVRLYDLAMTAWFDQHGMDDAGVVYVRYDELVTEFDRVVGEVLRFVGLDWDDAVRDFAASAERRSTKTPSYQKVRQGLKLGVQSSWRNYGFLFESAVAKPLHRWAEFFGYPTR